MVVMLKVANGLAIINKSTILNHPIIKTLKAIVHIIFKKVIKIEWKHVSWSQNETLSCFLEKRTSLLMFRWRIKGSELMAQIRMLLIHITPTDKITAAII